MGARTHRLDFKTRLKVWGGFLLASIVLTLVDLFYWWLSRLLPRRRGRRRTGRLVFRVRR